MGKKNRKKEKIVQEKAKFDNPFAALKTHFPEMPEVAAVQDDPPPEPESTTVPYDTLSVRTRIERKHRGGKTVTFVEGLGKTLNDAERVQLLADLKKSLGSGGFIEGDAVVLQGDVRDRVDKFFEKKKLG